MLKMFFTGQMLNVFNNLMFTQFCLAKNSKKTLIKIEKCLLLKDINNGADFFTFYPGWPVKN